MGHKRGGLLAILAVALVTLGLVLGMGARALAWEGNPYESLKNTTTVIKFDDKDWYLIEDDSTAVNAGTVTLLAKECVRASSYNSRGSGANYTGSSVEGIVNTWYAGNISEDAKTAVSGGKMFLLTIAQANAITNVDVRKCSQASGAVDNEWWLGSPGTNSDSAACVYGNNGNVNSAGEGVHWTEGVRPALKLNLESVTFSSRSKTFTVGSGPDKSALNDAITAAETLYDSIKDNTDYADIATTFQTAINTAKGVAESGEVDQDAVDTATSDIIAANTNAIIGIIDALPAASGVTMDDKAVIEAVRAAYDALDDTQKALVDANTLKKLTDAEAALAVAEVKAAIENLPAASAVTSTNKDAIEAARTAYNALDDDQKTAVGADALAKLQSCEVALAIVELPAPADITAANKDAVQAARAAYDKLSDAQKEQLGNDAKQKLEEAEVALVNKLIEALPEAGAVTTSDKDDIEAARAAYDALTEAQKGGVSPETLKRLTDAETALAAAEVADVVSKIDALPDAADVTTTNKEAIEAARAAYDALTDAQKTAVGTDALAKLEACEVSLVNKMIEALPAATDITTGNKEAIEAARAAYSALTDAQKGQVDANTLKKLTDAETALATAEVKAAIEALPAAKDITVANKNAVQAAKAAYDKLSDEQKEAVGNDAKAKLDACMTALAIAELPAPADITAANKDAVQAARAAYDKLSDAQKEQLGNEAKQKLEEAEVALVNKVIEALPEADAVTTDSKEAIEAARKAYDALSDAQKGQVDADTLKKLTDAETALATAEVKAAIEALPAAKDITVANKDAVQAARRAYDALSDGQKKEFPAEALKKLEAAEAALKKAEEAATGKEMYRLYNPNSGEHFYTSNAAERDNVKAAGWTYEGVGWVAPADGAPVYRLYNENGGEHHYTTSKNEHDVLVGLGWKDEGVGWRSAGKDGRPLYRQYNPNQFANNHNYTASTHERDTLLGLGWRDEGIAWYGIK